MSVDANKSAIRAFFAAIDRAQNMSPLDEFASPRYVAHFPGASNMSRDATKAFGGGFFQACPGLRHEVVEMVAEDDRVAARIVIHGTHTQPLMTPGGPIPPAGKSFALDVMNFYRFEQGKVIEHRSVFDMMGLMQAIGAMPGG